LAVNTTTSYAQPALIGGLVVGVLSALPIVSIGNLCCCLWIVSGGVVAAYVFQMNSAEPMTPADGALAGLLAGLVGAGVHLILSIPIDMVMGPFERSMAQRIMDMTGNAEMRDMLQRHSQRDAGFFVLILRRAAGFFFMLVAGAGFSTIGGLIGAMVFRRTPPPVPLDATPR
jgi:hypothetical protein